MACPSSADCNQNKLEAVVCGLFHVYGAYRQMADIKPLSTGTLTTKKVFVANPKCK